MEDLVIEILKKIRLYDDATVMDSMVEKGMPYKKIRGISIPELQQLSKPYAPNQELAERLWQNSTREVKIFAIMIADADKMTVEVFEKWLKSFNSSELPEQVGMGFLPHTEFAIKKMMFWANSPSVYISQTGIILAARLAQLKTELSDDFFSSALKNIGGWAEIENIHIQRAVARLINVLSAKSLFLNKELKSIVLDLEQSQSKSAQWIVQEVKWNINYNKEKF